MLGFRAPVSGTHEIMAAREHGDALDVRMSFLNVCLLRPLRGRRCQRSQNLIYWHEV